MKRFFLFSALVLFAVAPAHGGNCSWETLPDITVTSAYSVFSTTSYSVATTFSFRCTPNTTATVTFTRGSAPTYDPRTMVITNPPAGYAGSTLSYNMYNPAGEIWGDGSGGSVSATFTSSTAQKVYDESDGAIINSVVVGGSNVPPGLYSDTITASLSWSGGGGPNVRQFTVQTVVQPECVVSTFSLPFGKYDPLIANATAPLDATATVNVYCTPSTAATVALDGGQWSGGGSRRMRHPSGVFMNYDIFRDVARLTIWDTTNVNAATSGSKLTALGGGFVAYGRIPSGQDVAAGSYVDTVQAIVNY